MFSVLMSPISYNLFGINTCFLSPSLVVIHCSVFVIPLDDGPSSSSHAK